MGLLGLIVSLPTTGLIGTYNGIIRSIYVLNCGLAENVSCVFFSICDLVFGAI